jgi:hypothetical protein
VRIVQRIQQNVALIAAAIIAILNIVAVTGLWNPTGTSLAAINAAVAASLAFFVQAVPDLQSRRVRIDYARRAVEDSRELVPTAGSIIDQIVGRDDLCLILISNLHGRYSRPLALIGDAGAGKTGVLVRLTELLAEKGTIPVPIRLPIDDFDLDFEAVARDRFLRTVNPDLASSSDGEAIWRRLRKEKKICVLADALDDVLADEPNRDDVIRAAIRQAHQQRLPLVIASRSYTPFQATGAGILSLAPLSYGAALAYIGGESLGEDERRLAWIVETADVAEAPLYLQITRELQLRGLLEPTSAGQHGVVTTHGVDRSQLRLALLQTWERALTTGHLREDVPLTRTERQAAIEYMSALAIVGLMRDRLEVNFDDHAPEAILAEVNGRLATISQRAGRTAGFRNVDVRLAAAWAAQLDLVELHRHSVRFPHSLMQAYLASRLLNLAMLDPAYCDEALRLPRPSREFLIALVLQSRSAERAESAGAPLDLVAPILQEAGRRDDNRILDIYAAALEMDCVTAEPQHQSLSAEISERWSRIHAHDPRTLDESKLALVRQLGESARTIDERLRHGAQFRARPAYAPLYAIGCSEGSHPVHLAVAQEIGAGGNAAYQELRHLLTAPCAACAGDRAGRDGVVPNLMGGNEGFRAAITSAWLAPMLAGTVGDSEDGAENGKLLAKQARDDLAQWLRHVSIDRRRPGEEDLPISLEIALARGFKYAANRRPSHPGQGYEARQYLAEEALELLKSTRYWFSQLTLLQALCLLELPEWSNRTGVGVKPEAIVQHWLDVAGRERFDFGNSPPGSHPFVREAASLCTLALRTGRPQRYLWIDESEVVPQVGSRNLGRSAAARRHGLWIPPSAGWAALEDRAQQLVADVVLLLNLADRGDQPSERERRLRRSNRRDLPPCITHYRESLEPGLTVGTAAPSVPGVSCVDGCAFELCPYPPKGSQEYWTEMDEAFCEKQCELVGARWSIRKASAPWQEMRASHLRRFWADMADRAIGPRPSRFASHR